MEFGKLLESALSYAMSWVRSQTICQTPYGATTRNRTCEGITHWFWIQSVLRKLEAPIIPLPFPAALLEVPKPTLGGREDESKILVLQTMESGIRSLMHPPSNNIAQPSTLMQVKTAQALSRLLPHNQLGLKELILPPSEAITHMPWERRRYRIITIMYNNYNSTYRPMGPN